MAQDFCATPSVRQSSLSSVGRGGLLASPEQAGSVAVDPERFKRLLPVTEALPSPQSDLVIPVTWDHGEPKVELARTYSACQQ